MIDRKEDKIEKDKIPLLNKQFEFIENSACLFDIGKKNEAVRIALAIRVLMHDTSRSTSALEYAGIKNKLKIFSTRNPEYEFDGSGGEGVTLTGLALLGDPPTLKLFANMHRYSFCKSLSVKDWWEEKIIYTKKLGALSRKNLCIAAANKNGGAHVDELPEKFKRLESGDTGFNVIVSGKEVCFAELWPHTLRQMAWEILNSNDVMVIRNSELN